MAAGEAVITDPVLLSVLKAATEARKQCLDLVDLLEARGDSPPPLDTPDEEVSRHQKRLTARLAILRGLNRKAILSVRATKQQTTEARQEIDSLHLQLQNLYYEQRHLRGEIAACEDFDHKFQRLPMIPIDEYLTAHPEHAEASEHDLTLARISDEHEARQVLGDQRLALMKRKDALIKETNAKKEELGKLDSEVEKWIGGQDNVKKIFDARDKKLEEQRVSDEKQGEASAVAA